MQTWQFIHDKLSAEQRVILLYVLQSEGSSPGRQGFTMAVADDDSFCGSIGGGMMEHKFVELAKAKLIEGVAVTSLYRQVHDKEAGKNKSGMICSGEQTIFVYEVNRHDLLHIAAMLVAIKNNKNGALTITNSGIKFDDNIPAHNFHFEKMSDDDFVLIEKTGCKNQLHIIGGGHCALALSKLMSDMDFYIHVYEDRKELNTIEQNTYAHFKYLLHSFQALEDLVPSGRNVYVVIMTFGYKTDDVALKALLHKSFKYIGLLGSKFKIAKMFSGYAENTEEKLQLDKVFSPIGIQIKSQTPPEIAVSIAAEIIREKNKDQ